MIYTSPTSTSMPSPQKCNFFNITSILNPKLNPSQNIINLNLLFSSKINNNVLNFSSTVNSINYSKYLSQNQNLNL